MKKKHRIVCEIPAAQFPSAVPEVVVHSAAEMQMPRSLESELATHSLF